jgi:hypothetical protein
VDTRNKLASNSNEGMTDDSGVTPARLASNSSEDAASDDD